MSSPHGNPAQRTANDAPRDASTCVSYLPGHHVHYIPVLRYSTTRAVAPGHLELTDDALRLIVGDERIPVHTHNAQALRELVDRLGGSCRWYPSLNYASWPDGNLRHWVNLSLSGLTPCVFRAEAQLREW